jgi:hypothetical protein
MTKESSHDNMMSLKTLKTEQENAMEYQLTGEKIQPLGGDVDEVLHGGAEVIAVDLRGELLHDVEASCTRPSSLQH